MKFVRSRNLYNSLPPVAKQAISAVPFGWLAGKKYRETMARRVEIDDMNRAEIMAWQEKNIGNILEFATTHVPAYKKYRKAVSRFSPFDALKEFSLLVKDDLQDRFEEFLPDNLDNIPHYEISTGGTSGNQLNFYVESSSQAIELGFMHRQWQRIGYTPRSRKATFRGVAFPDLDSGIYWQHNPIYNELQFSPFHMSEITLGSYVEQIHRYKPQYLHGFPSAIDILAEYVERNSLHGEFSSLKAVLLGSEGVLPGQIERIESAFKSRAFSWYGHSERLIMAGECESTDAYHQFPDYGLAEIIDDTTNEPAKIGERGELVGTGFINRSMPLIRYKTGDTATRLDTACECGRNWDRFTDVEGRWDQHMVIGKNGENISIAALNMHGPIFKKVQRYQYFQESIGVCELRVMVSPQFTEGDRLDIEHAYLDKIGTDLALTVNIVEDIPLTSRGKLKLLDSKLT